MPVPNTAYSELTLQPNFPGMGLPGDMYERVLNILNTLGLNLQTDSETGQAYFSGSCTDYSDWASYGFKIDFEQWNTTNVIYAPLASFTQDDLPND